MDFFKLFQGSEPALHCTDFRGKSAVGEYTSHCFSLPFLYDISRQLPEIIVRNDYPDLLFTWIIFSEIIHGKGANDSARNGRPGMKK